MTVSFDNQDEVIAFVRDAVNDIADPCGLALGLSIGLAEMGLIRSLDVQPVADGWAVNLKLRLTSPGCFYFVYFEEQIRERVKAATQITTLNITFDPLIDWTPDEMSDTARAKLKEHRHRMLAGERWI